MNPFHKRRLAHATAVLAATLWAAWAMPAAAAPASAAASYSVQQRWALGDAGRWDYLDVDPVRHRLYLSRGDHVQVLELPSGKVLGQIAGTAGVHGVAFAQDLKLGFTSNGRADSVTVFDLDTLAVKQEVKVNGHNPDAILYEPSSHKLYTFNGRSADVSVLDAASMKPLATIAVGGKPEFAAAAGGKVYVNIEDKAEIAVIDVAGNQLAAHWPLAGCTDPTGLALDEAHQRLFSVCQNQRMVVTDAASGKHVADVAIGDKPDAALYDAASATVFSSNGGGTLSVVRQLDADHYAPAVSVPTEKGARTLAMDHASNTLYLPVALNKQFTVLVVGAGAKAE
jgi:YVTN family beta-propeller protein